MIEERSQCFSA
jgi:hypothetical protein